MDTLIYLTDNAYTKDELKAMEHDVAKILDFNFVFPLAYDFYEIDAKILNFTEEEFYLGLFFIESFLLSSDCEKIPGSVLAITCCYIVMKFFKKKGFEACYDANLLGQGQVR